MCLVYFDWFRNSTWGLLRFFAWLQNKPTHCGRICNLDPFRDERKVRWFCRPKRAVQFGCVWSSKGKRRKAKQSKAKLASVLVRRANEQNKRDVVDEASESNAGVGEGNFSAGSTGLVGGRVGETQEGGGSAKAANYYHSRDAACPPACLPAPVRVGQPVLCWSACTGLAWPGLD